jgi:hypothetical protein
MLVQPVAAFGRSIGVLGMQCVILLIFLMPIRLPAKFEDLTSVLSGHRVKTAIVAANAPWLQEIAAIKAVLVSDRSVILLRLVKT